MNTIAPSSAIPRPAPESSMMNARTNNHVQTLSPPASDSPAASTTRSHQYGCAAFLRQTDLAQKFLLKKAKSSMDKGLADFLRKFDASRWSPKSRIKLAERLAEINPQSLVRNIKKFKIADESARIELALIMAEKSPSTLLSSLSRFISVSSQPTLACLCAAAYLNAIGKGGVQIEEVRSQKLREEFMPGNPEPLSLSLAQAVEQFGHRHPVIDGFLKAAEEQPDPRLRETLSLWANLVSLRFAASPIPEKDWEQLQVPLQAIWKLHAPAMRYTLADMLIRQYLPPTASNANGFLAFGQQFTKPHTHLYPLLLFPIFEAATDSPALKRLVTLLHRPEFKDAKRQKAMLSALQVLAQADCLSNELKRKLLQTALPSSSGKEAAHALVETASCIECLVSLAQQDTPLGKSVLQRLESIQSPDDFHKQMMMVFNELFQLQHLPDAHKVREQFSRYWEQSRQPMGLLNYAAKMNAGLTGADKALVLDALRQFAEAVVLSPEPEEAFRKLRYDPGASTHLRILKSEAPAAFEKWQQPCVYQPSAAFLAQASGSQQTDIATYLRDRVVRYRHVPEGTFPLLEDVLNGQKTLAAALEMAQAASRKQEANLLQLLDEGTPVTQKAALITELLPALPEAQHQFRSDLRDLQALLTPVSLQDTKQFRVIDTDAAEDLLLCGTEVGGSCQNIYGVPFANKALMGYVMDGKYRMLAIKSEDGRLMGRRMLRLLWDEKEKKPVLHLEVLYYNPGLPEKYARALIELAQQKAKQMGCKLVSHDCSLKRHGDYSAPLKAYPTSWPFEYVDAGLGIKAGKDGYELLNAMMVASPY